MAATRVLTVGMNHRTAPVSLRERLAVDASACAQVLHRLCQLPAVAEAVILSTCNRVEIYVAARHAGEARRQLLHFMADWAGIPAADLEPHLYWHEDGAAARHLFRVAAGLDSMVVGESQVLGQVRDAYQLAAGSGACGKVLHALFQHALSAGKRARAETAISQHAVSVSYVAVELARKVFGDLAGRQVLLIGAGEMAELAARSLADGGGCELVVANRTLERGRQLAAAYGGRAVPLEQLAQILPECDVVISSTGAGRPILSAEMVRETMRRRRQRPLLLIDIAVPVTDLEIAAAAYERQVSRLVSEDEETATYVAQLESSFDDPDDDDDEDDAELAAEVLVEEVEQFLRNQE